ncbi:MAG TPA: sialate O-acetylesterase [Longimicrobiaceae bacterium]
MRRAALLFLFAAAACSEAAAPSADEGWDLYLLAGQSNLVGQAPPEGFATPELGDRAWELILGEWVPLREPLRGNRYAVGPIGAFAAATVAQKDSRTVGVVICGAGNTGIAEWQKGSPSALYGSCLFQAQEARVKGTFRGVVFAQGENDGLGGEGARPAEWGALFARWAADVRADLGDPELPVVYSQVGTPGPAFAASAATWAEVQRQQAGAGVPRSRMVPTSDLPTLDGLHFTRDAYQEIGRRWARAMAELRGRAR